MFPGSIEFRRTVGARGRPSESQTLEASLSLVEIEEIARTYFESASELKDVIETDILFSAFYFTHEIAVDLYHLAQLFLGQAPFRAYGT